MAHVQADIAKVQADRDNLQAQLRAQAASEDQKVKVAHQEYALADIDKHQQAVTKIENDTNSKYYRLRVINNCNKAIAIALRYPALDGSIFVEGWYTLEPGESDMLADLNDTWFAYSAHAGNINLAGNENQEVSDEAFTYVEDLYYEAGWLQLRGNLYEASFKMVDFKMQNYGVYEHSITCAQ
jgi:hypothetical protein